MHSLVEAVPVAIAALLERQPLSPAKVAFAWRVAVGPAMARATDVARRPDGTLAVTAADRHWLREVRSAREVILARLRQLLGPGVVLRLVVDARGGTGGAQGGRRPGPDAGDAPQTASRRGR